MPWFVQYQQAGVVQIERMGAPELAIETAGRLLDDGVEVLGIGVGQPGDAIGKEHIARIYAMWVRDRPCGQVASKRAPTIPPHRE